MRVTDDVALACVKEAAGTIHVELEALFSTSLPNSPMAGARVRVASGNFVTARPVGVIDGVDYVPANSVYHAPWLSYPPARTVIDDDSGKVSITPVNDAYVNLARTGDYSYSYITVESGPYRVRLAYVNGDGAIDFNATDAGMCGIPGGAWGSSLGGRNVGHSQPYGGGYSQIASYQVTSAASKSPEFFWSRACDRSAAINAASVARLIK